MKVALYTLGCKVNQYESQAMEGELLRRGHTLVPFEGEAEAYLINTCTVTSVSDKKCRAAIRRVRREHPGAVVAVWGCYAQMDPSAVAELGADLVWGTRDRLGLLEALERRLEGEEPPEGAEIAVRADRAGEEFERLPAGSLAGHTRALLKVEDGCDNFCTYCIIPSARGRVRSRPAAEAAAQAGRLKEEGYREIVLTGIEISSWGKDLEGEQGLIDLIETVRAAAPGVRLRLGSLEPRTITPDFCARASAIPELCPHFHLSLQSGCDATLRRMNRRYDTRRYLESVELLRRSFSDPAIAADVITGFPGETEEEFETTLAFLARCAFSTLHVFPYSRRPGTPAAKLPEQVKREEKEARSRRAIALGKELEGAYLARQVGKREQVLFEEKKDGLWRGHAPNYTEVRLASGEELHNVLKEVRLTGAGDGFLKGSIEP